MSKPVPILMLTSAAFLALLPCLGAAQDGLPATDPPAADQQSENPAPQADEGLSLIGRGIGLLMQNLFQDIGPDLDRIGEDMSGALSRLAPALGDLSALVDDIGNYQAPERLENGDILIRRKQGAPPPPPIGDNLRNLTRPRTQDGQPPAGQPRPDPTQPEISL